MNRFPIPIAAVLIGVSLAAAPVRGQQGPSPEQINQAIDQGVAYLKKTQGADGVWSYAGHDLGMTALGGLALFESQLPRNDPAIVRAEEYVIRRAPSETRTYDLGLAILFLSRLHPHDRGEIRDLIRGMAWKLAAGEKGGGWSYTNPERPPFPMPIVERAAPPVAESSAPATGDQGRAATAEAGKPAPSVSGLGGVSVGKSPAAGSAHDQADGAMPRANGKDEFREPPVGKLDDPSRPNENGIGKESEGEEAEKAERAKPAPKPKRLNPRIEARLKREKLMLMRTYGDHSNTQFGMLGVWVAGHYGYDSSPTLANLGERFLMVQRPDGAWGYRADGSVVHGPEAMTCVGLLALYLAAGNDQGDGRDAAGRGRELESNRTYRRGLEAVTAYAKRIDRSAPTYFLWSLERLCVALGKEKLDGFDWYKAGAQVLIDRQQLDGSWNDGQWGAEPDTCLALLFLHRSNLASGIENEVRLADFKDISGLPTVAMRVDPPERTALEQPDPGSSTPIVAIPNANPEPRAGAGNGPDRQAGDPGIARNPAPSGAEPGDDRQVAVGEGRPTTGTGRPAGPLEDEPRLRIVVVIALLILLAIPAWTGRWHSNP